MERAVALAAASGSLYADLGLAAAMARSTSDANAFRLVRCEIADQFVLYGLHPCAGVWSKNEIKRAR